MALGGDSRVNGLWGDTAPKPSDDNGGETPVGCVCSLLGRHSLPLRTSGQTQPANRGAGSHLRKRAADPELHWLSRCSGTLFRDILALICGLFTSAGPVR